MTRHDVTITTDELGPCRIAVHAYGSGPPLLLVHGLMNPAYSFRYVLDLLGGSSSAPPFGGAPRSGEAGPCGHHRLWIPDLPGGGASDCPDVYLGPDVLARALIATIDALGIRGAPAIGNSMGGYISMRAALLDPGAIGRLVNLHSPGVPTAKMAALRWALRLLPSWPIVDRLVCRDPERWVHKNVHYYDESLKCREDLRILGEPLHTRAGRRGFYRHLRDTLDTREMKRFVRALRDRPFPIPLLLVYAERDPIVPPSVGHKLHALVPDAQLVWMREASHFAHIDAAPRFVAAIEPFLAAGTASSSLEPASTDSGVPA